MPRGAQPQHPGKLQTTKQARRAYQKAGPTPKLNLAQIRAAERAAEADKRAKEIVAKEKRARDNKRKKDAQEAKQRKEQRRLVREGKLPEESLWGKVGRSQPRLHNFLGAPQQGEPSNAGNASQAEQQAEAAQRANVADDEFGEFTSSLDDSPSSTPTLLRSQTTVKPSPWKPEAVHAHLPQENAHFTIKQYAPDTSLSTQQQLEAQLSFSGSQLFGGFADDVELEAELNGHCPLVETANESSPPTVNRTRNLVAEGESRKRKANSSRPGTPPLAKTTRLVFAELSPSDLNVRAQKVASTTPDQSPPKLLLQQTSISVHAVDFQTASQVEALIGSQDFDDDELECDKENVNPLRGALIKAFSSNTAQPAKSDAIRLPTKLRINEQQEMPRSTSGLRGDKTVLANIAKADDDSEGEFGDGFDDETFKLVSKGCDIASISSETSSKALPGQNMPQLDRPVQASAPQTEPLMTHDSPCGLKIRDLLNVSQSSSYSLDGVAEEDLVGLADKFNSSQKLDRDEELRHNQSHTSPPKRDVPGSVKPRRTIPWDKSGHLLAEDVLEGDFPNEEDFE
jgi:hypothetical protein